MYVKEKQTIGYGCGVHPFQVYTPEHTGAHPPPNVMDWPVIALCAMRPPALPPPPSASTSGSPGVLDFNRVGGVQGTEVLLHNGGDIRSSPHLSVVTLGCFK
jgi:hypothetical protein